MRFAILIRATRSSEIGIIPRPGPEDPDNAMVAFAKMLAREHYLVDIQSLHPSSEGQRVSLVKKDGDGRDFINSRQSVTLNMSMGEVDGKHVMLERGPFPTEEVLTGWAVIDVPDWKTAQDCVEKSPFPMTSVEITMEIRRVHEARSHGHEQPSSAEHASDLHKICHQVRKQGGTVAVICENIPDYPEPGNPR